MTTTPIPSAASRDDPSRNSTDRAYEAIKRQIMTLRLRPGERVTEERLVDVMHARVSKTPIREALRWLIKDGFVQRDGRFYVIAPLTVRTIRDLYDLRVVLESAVIDRVFSRGFDPAVLTNLQVQDEFKVDRTDPDAIRDYLIEADTLHMTLARLSGYVELTRFLNITLEKLNPAQQVMLRSVPDDRLVLCQHDGVVSALTSKDPERSRAAMVDHIRASEELVLETLLDFHGEITLPPAFYSSRRHDLAVGG